MPKSRVIPDDVKQRAAEAVERFNREHLRKTAIRYVPRFKGRFLYLDREDYGSVGEACRLEFTGDFDKWEFAIFKYSRETYDPGEWMFPGSEAIDGTIEGAMLAGLEAYPP